MSDPVYVALAVALLLYFLDRVRNPKRIQRLADQVRAHVLAQGGHYTEADATPEHEAAVAEVQRDFEGIGYRVLTDLALRSGHLLRVVSDAHGEHCVAIHRVPSTDGPTAEVEVEVETELTDGRYVSTLVRPSARWGLQCPGVLMEQHATPWAAADLIEHHCRRVEELLARSHGTSVLRRRQVQDLLDSLHRQAVLKASHRLKMGFSDDELRAFGVLPEDFEKLRAALAQPLEDPSVF